MKNRRLAQLLLISTFIVSSPRWVGLFAAVIGVNLVEVLPSFKWFEIFSGLPAALLEGVALAYLSSTWKNYTKNNKDRNIYWYSLLVGQIAILIAIPIVITPYLVATQLQSTVNGVLPPAVLWIWTFLVAALNPLMAIAVGLLEDDSVTADETDSNKKTMALGLLTERGKLSPDELATTLKIPLEDAAKHIATWHNGKDEVLN